MYIRFVGDLIDDDHDASNQIDDKLLTNANNVDHILVHVETLRICQVLQCPHQCRQL